MSDGPKIGRAPLLRMEADAVEAEEKFAAAKSDKFTRERCEECGRLKLPTKAQEKARVKARQAMQEKRIRFRAAREGLSEEATAALLAKRGVDVG